MGVRKVVVVSSVIGGRIASGGEPRGRRAAGGAMIGKVGVWTGNRDVTIVMVIIGSGAVTSLLHDSSATGAGRRRRGV